MSLSSKYSSELNWPFYSGFEDFEKFSSWHLENISGLDYRLFIYRNQNTFLWGNREFYYRPAHYSLPQIHHMPSFRSLLAFAALILLSWTFMTKKGKERVTFHGHEGVNWSFRIMYLNIYIVDDLCPGSSPSSQINPMTLLTATLPPDVLSEPLPNLSPDILALLYSSMGPTSPSFADCLMPDAPSPTGYVSSFLASEPLNAFAWSPILPLPLLPPVGSPFSSCVPPSPLSPVPSTSFSSQISTGLASTTPNVIDWSAFLPLPLFPSPGVHFMGLYNSPSLGSVEAHQHTPGSYSPGLFAYVVTFCSFSYFLKFS